VFINLLKNIVIWGFTTLEWREIGVPRMDLENQQAHPALL
jgi:hypothetical protein